MTLIPLSKRRDWWIRAMDFPCLQIVILSIIWLIFWFGSSTSSGFFAYSLSLAVFCVLVYQCSRIYPYTEMHALEIDSYMPGIDGEKQSLKMISCNVLMSNRDSSTLQRLINHHQPDIFIALESDLWWEQQFDALTDYSYALKCPLNNLYGMHLYSRYPLTNTAITFEFDHDKPSMSARIETSPQTFIDLFVVHPAPPTSQANVAPLEGEGELLKVANHLAKRTNRIIVVGDFNDVTWSATTRLFKTVSGLLDPRVGRGLFNTFNAFHWFARWPLDHVFVSRGFKVSAIKRLPTMGSDHFPLCVELAIMQTTENDVHSPEGSLVNVEDESNATTSAEHNH